MYISNFFEKLILLHNGQEVMFQLYITNNLCYSSQFFIRLPNKSKNKAVYPFLKKNIRIHVSE